jgi:phosphotransferase system HPr-like phosphotransfer protein
MFYNPLSLRFIKLGSLSEMRKENGMHTRKLALLSVLAMLFISSYVMLAYATDNEGSLKSGYAVTSNYHGINVPPNTAVTVTAMTTDRCVDVVKFIWKNPAGQVMFEEIKKVYSNGTTFNDNGRIKLVYFANSTFTPDAMGDWGVQAKFIDVNGFCWCCCTKQIHRRATSFNVIPEVPVIGTVGASAAMFAGLGYKIKRKRQK